MKKFILALMLFASPAFSAPYFAFDYYGPWQDTDKIGFEDSQMCWAASISNVIAYAGWDMGMGADGVFDVYRQHFKNEGSYGYSALQWWFTGISEYDTQDVAGGGGYFPEHRLDDYVHIHNIFAEADFLTDIDAWLRLGMGINMTFSSPRSAHGVTVYGVDVENPGIWYVDGNDRADRLIYTALEWAWMDDYQAMGWFALNGPWNGWSINNLYGLNQFPNPVPEPGTLFLVSIGLIGLVRRRTLRLK